MISRISFLIILLIIEIQGKRCPMNCEKCDKKKQKCEKCKEFHGLTSNYCFQCKIENCIDCSGNPEKCVRCSPFYYYSSLTEECIFCGYGCQECASKIKCSSCSFLFKFGDDGKNCVFNLKIFLLIVMILLGPCFVVWIFGCWALNGRKNFKVYTVGGVELETERRELKK